MADKVTAASKEEAAAPSPPTKAEVEAEKSAPGAPAEKPEQDVLIPVAEDAAVEGTDHNANINKALDAAKEAMIASGISEGDAEAFLNSARPRGVSTVTGNYADLQRMTGLPQVTLPEPDRSRLKFAHKVPEEIPEPPVPTKGF